MGAAGVAKRIVSLLLHVAPRTSSATANVCTGPPDASTHLSLPSATNPILRLSGDQNGWLAPSVPPIGCETTASSERSHSCVFPFAFAANTRRRPSGEIAIDVGSSVGGVTT